GRLQIRGATNGREVHRSTRRQVVHDFGHAFTVLTAAPERGRGSVGPTERPSRCGELARGDALVPVCLAEIVDDADLHAVALVAGRVPRAGTGLRDGLDPVRSAD